MADIRPKDLAPTATSPAADDYLLLDGTTEGTRKVLALAETVNVMRFGAINDGSAATRSHIQAAITAGARIFIPKGDYLLDSTVMNGLAGKYVFGEPGTRLIVPAGMQTVFNCNGTQPSTFNALTANAALDAKTVTIADTTGYAAGNWVFIRSNDLIAGPNAQAEKCAEWNEVESLTSTVLTLRYPLVHPYTTANVAEVGIGAPVVDFELSDMDIELAAAADQAFNAVRANNAHGVKVRRVRARGGRGATTHIGISHFNVAHCHDFLAEDCESVDPGWYGVMIGGACRNTRVERLHGVRTRHDISVVNSATYGEPIGVIGRGGVSYDSVFSALDTHDTGRNIIFSDYEIYNPGENGILIRNNDTASLENIYIDKANIRGLLIETGRARPVRATNITIKRAVQSGINCGSAILGSNFVIEDCVGAMEIAEGSIRGVYARRNGTVVWARRNGTVQRPLNISGLDALFEGSGVQTTVVNRQTDTAAVTSLITITDSDLPGYPAGFLSRWLTSSELVKGANFLDCRLHASAAHSGTATLSAGAATISTAAVRNAASSGTTTGPSAERTLIELTPIGDGTDAGALYVEQITNGTSFVVKSTNASDSRQFMWRIRGVV